MHIEFGTNKEDLRNPICEIYSVYNVDKKGLKETPTVISNKGITGVCNRTNWAFGKAALPLILGFLTLSGTIAIVVITFRCPKIFRFAQYKNLGKEIPSDNRADDSYFGEVI